MLYRSLSFGDRNVVDMVVMGVDGLGQYVLEADVGRFKGVIQLGLDGGGNRFGENRLEMSMGKRVRTNMTREESW